ncbi:hypothetical protein [Paraburkholderia bannensis]|uniref:hypothetical protein n=1 Tax=Paraburkholderia bannensis TaxID=765414 RepID=UPI002ABD90D4|nr:hypothetical protein [Paraburkholderia bannensis]
MNNFYVSFVVAICIGLTAPIARANVTIDDSNCMQYLGGGGFGDYDCYEDHAKSLDIDNKRLVNQIVSSSGIKKKIKTDIYRYVKGENEAVKSCGLAPTLALDWAIVTPQKSHIDMYDVMEARCHYSIRKRENEFLRDLYSIKTDN